MFPSEWPVGLCDTTRSNWLSQEKYVGVEWTWGCQATVPLDYVYKYCNDPQSDVYRGPSGHWLRYPLESCVIPNGGVVFCID